LRQLMETVRQMQMVCALQQTSKLRTNTERVQLLRSVQRWRILRRLLCTFAWTKRFSDDHNSHLYRDRGRISLSCDVSQLCSDASHLHLTQIVHSTMLRVKQLCWH
jgi:hypothetical protein